MQSLISQGPWWAAMLVWGVVNAVNRLQSAGFLSRIVTGGMAVNHLLGYVMIVLVAPALLAIVAFAHTQAGWRHWIGPAVYVAFVALMIAVDYVSPTEFRSPPRYGILAPYLVLFFGAILLMGLPMFRLNPRWEWRCSKEWDRYRETAASVSLCCPRVSSSVVEFATELT